MTVQPLSDITILDLSRIYAGPAGSMILADLGARVIRVEAPGGTDSMRDWNPLKAGESTYYMCANRNKESVTLNLKSAEGKQLLLRMLETADVVIENFKTGTLERMGLGYDVLRSAKPDVILLSITGYGQTGPYQHEPGFDPILQAIGGVMDVTGHPGGEPTRSGLPLVDMMTSEYVAISLLAAIRQRDRTGTGQHIDLSLFDVQLSALANVAGSYLNTGQITQRSGNDHYFIMPYQVFYCADRPLMVTAGNDRLYAALCDCLGHPEWTHDPRFATNNLRVQHRGELGALIQAVFSQKSADEWSAVLSAAGVPSGSVNNVAQVFDHPQSKARDVVEEVEHPKLGTVKLVRSPLRFSEFGVRTRRYPPMLGEHTEAYYRELGLSEEQLARLKEDGVI
jgi:crotonobetainyl-CoA:carnitine CoA-transferase CaiB-like acyl-CoA transferase